MSEFHVVELEIEDRDSIVEALKEIGYTPIVHTEAQQLHGYHGDLRVQKAHIIIPKSQISQASNDIGFEKVGEKYIMHISAFDEGRESFNKNKFIQLYNNHKITKFIKKNLKRFSLKSTKIKKDGTIAITIRRLG